MKIEELIKDLYPVTIIEFKNYIIEHLSDLCSVKNADVNYIKMEKRKMVFKNIYVVVVRQLYQKQQIQ